MGDPYRRTEREAARRAGRPAPSAFHRAASGAVGAAAIRGMPCLAHLRDAGFAVWPFDPTPPDTPTAVELWPPLCHARAVEPADPDSRAAFLASLGGPATALPAHARRTAESSDLAFDTLSGAIALWEGRAALAVLPPARDVLDRLEGRIWEPPATAGAPSAGHSAPDDDDDDDGAWGGA